MLLKLLREERPSHLAVVFDAPGETFRDALYADYKANRTGMPDELAPQLPLVRRLVAALAIPVLEERGVEADDVIGTLATRAAAAGTEVVIVTGDKDLQQLVERAHVRCSTRCATSAPALAEVRERYGVEPERWVDIVGLMGDAIDNIPGIRGVGEKTAAALIRHAGSLEALLDGLDGHRASGIRGAKGLGATRRASTPSRPALAKTLADDPLRRPARVDARRLPLRGPMQRPELEELLSRARVPFAAARARHRRAPTPSAPCPAADGRDGRRGARRARAAPCAVRVVLDARARRRCAPSCGAWRSRRQRTRSVTVVPPSAERRRRAASLRDAACEKIGDGPEARDASSSRATACRSRGRSSTSASRRTCSIRRGRATASTELARHFLGSARARRRRTRPRVPRGRRVPRSRSGRSSSARSRSTTSSTLFRDVEMPLDARPRRDGATRRAGRPRRRSTRARHGVPRDARAPRARDLRARRRRVQHQLAAAAPRGALRPAEDLHHAASARARPASRPTSTC